MILRSHFILFIATALKASTRPVKPPVEEVILLEDYQAAANVDFGSDWVVGGGTADGFQTSWATHFVCGLHGKATADVGIIEVQAVFCEKDGSQSSIPETLTPDASFSSTDVTLEGSVNCPEGHFLHGIWYYANDFVESSDNNLGINDLVFSCESPSNSSLAKFEETSSPFLSALDNTQGLKSNPKGTAFPPSNHFICGVNALDHSPATGDKFGIIGLKLLYCEFCLGASSSDACYPAANHKPSPASDGTLTPLLFTGTTLYSEISTQGENEIQCFDEVSEEGMMVVGGMTMDPKIHKGIANWRYPWLGIKTKEQTTAPNSWAWLAAHQVHTQNAFELCKFSPIIEHLGRRVIVGITRGHGQASQLQVVDPDTNGEGTFSSLSYRTLYHASQHAEAPTFPHRTLGMIVRQPTYGTVEVITSSPYSTQGYMQLLRITLDLLNFRGTQFLFYLKYLSVSDMALGMACLEGKDGELYFGMGKTVAAGEQAAIILKYKHDNYKDWKYGSDNFTETGFGFQAVEWRSPYEAAKWVDEVSLLTLNERITGLIHRHLHKSATVRDYISDKMSFVGQCYPDDFTSFYRLEFQMPSKMNVWPKTLHSSTPTLFYAAVADLTTTDDTTELYFFCIVFDPDPADCSSLQFNSPPAVTMTVSHSLCSPYDKCQYFGAGYLASADSIVVAGTSLKFKETASSSEESVGFLTGLTLAAIDGSSTALKVTSHADAAVMENPSQFNQPHIIQTLTMAKLTWREADTEQIRDFQITKSACSGDLSLNEGSSYTNGFTKQLVLNLEDSNPNLKTIELSQIFSQANAGSCPLTSCSVLQYEDEDGAETVGNEFLYPQERCRYAHPSSKISVDAAGGELKFALNEVEIFGKICVVCRNEAEAVMSKVFNVEVLNSPCVLQPIQPTMEPIVEREYEYNVYYDLDSKRFPTASWNVSEAVIDLIEEKLITVEDFTVCAPTAYEISQVLQNDSATVVPPATWSPYISIDTATGKVTISKYGNADPDFFRNITIQIEASNEFQNLPATSLVKLSFVEKVTLEVSKPPVFVEELEPVEIKITTFGKGEAITVNLPEVTDANGDTIEPLQVYVHGPYEQFLKFDQSTTSLTFLPDKITPKDAEDFPEFSVPIRIIDHRGEITEVFLDCTISAKLPEPEPEEEEESGGFIGVVIPVEEPIEEEEPEVVLPPPPPIELPKLRAFFKDITTLGVLTIGLNLPFKPIDISILDETAISMSIAPGESPAPSNFNFQSLDFVWECTGVNLADQEITFQLNFSNAATVSPDIKSQDQLTIHFKKPDLFVSRDYNEKLVAGSYLAQGAVKKQMPNTPASQNFDAGTDQTGKSLVVTTLVSQGLTIFFQAAMKELLGTILALQVIIHLFLMMVPFPGNISNFVSKLKPIASFNILKVVTKYTVKIFNFDVDAQNALRYKIITPAQDMGIKQHNAVQNLGNVFHLLGFYFISVIAMLAARAYGHFNDRGALHFIRLKRKLFFGQIIGLLVAGFIPVTIASYFQLKAPLSSTIGERLGFVSAEIAVTLAYVFLPASLIYILVVDKETLEKPAFKQVWGSLYSNVRIDTRSQRAFRHVFLLRRLLILAVGFLLFEEPPLQMVAVNVMNISVVLFQGLSEPFKTKHERNLDLFTEAMVTFITYHLFMFSDVLPDADAQYLIGWSFVVMLSIMLGSNSYFVVAGIIHRSRLLVLRKLHQRQHEARMFVIMSHASPDPSETSAGSPSVIPLSPSFRQLPSFRKSASPTRRSSHLHELNTASKLKLFKQRSQEYTKQKRLSHKTQDGRHLSIIREDSLEDNEELYTSIYNISKEMMKKYRVPKKKETKRKHRQ